jgi:RNA polymerase sigma-70 factor, ECF subfamily
MMIGQSFQRKALRGHISKLRAFATLLCLDTDLAEDLVCETLTRTLGNPGSLVPELSISTWLLAMLHKCFYRKRLYYTGKSIQKGRNVTIPANDWETSILLVALAALKDIEREAVILIDVSGVSYTEAAEICGCHVKIIRRRVSRGRQQLCHLYAPWAVRITESVPASGKNSDGIK